MVLHFLIIYSCYNASHAIDWSIVDRQTFFWRIKEIHNFILRRRSFFQFTKQAKKAAESLETAGKSAVVASKSKVIAKEQNYTAFCNETEIVRKEILFEPNSLCTSILSFLFDSSRIGGHFAKESDNLTLKIWTV